ncbi:MAG TPA: PQQ-dependent sugar dehydrogenase, partial [Candidatus Sulfotelmatobacter sp.]|nr:PQQ-dependent sugar dehydrogenase [Candidatus Sulfotelmatobacter sp.]
MKRYISLITTAAAGALALAAVATSGAAGAQNLKHYDSNNANFWSHPPDDWFLGDETQQQKGLAPPANPPTPASMAELEANLKKIKLPPGFKISVYAANVPTARQMAWGDKGTLFVGSWFGTGSVFAVVGPEGHKEVKTIIKGLTVPTGVAFRDGALYVVDISKVYKYDNAEASLDKMPAPTIYYDDMPNYVPHGWKYLVFDKQGRMYIPFGPPCNICLPPTSVSQIRRVYPGGTAEILALGVRNSVGGDVDPRTGDYWFTENARDWISDDLPSDKLNHIGRIGEHFGYPYCHQGDMLDPKYGAGHKCSEFAPPALNLGAHVAPLGMKFYTGKQFPAEYRDNIFIAEHGSWNRHKYQGGRIVRVVTDPTGKSAKQEVFASGWIAGDQKYNGRP